MILSPSSAKDDHGYMSPSIPSEIGSRGNFHAYFINDTEHEHSSMNSNQQQSSSAACLGISRPTYESPDNDKLDFSPILQSRKRSTNVKSALDKYQKASTTGTSSRSEMPQGSKGTGTSTSAAGLTYLATAVAQAMQQDDSSHITTHEGSYNSVSHTKSPTAFRNPIKALKQATRSRNSKRSIPIPMSNGEENSISTLDMDGSIDMYRSVTAQVKTATQKMEALNNDRFFTPAQQYNSNITQNRSFFHHRRQRSKQVNNVLSPSTTDDDDDVPRLCSATSDSQTTCKGQGIGIAPPPNSSTSRIIVPYVTPDDTKSKYSFTVFILLIQPTQKIFELIRVNYDPSNATLQHLVDMIPSNSSEEDLSNQTYVGLVRPNASSSSNKSLSNLSVTASVMARDGSCARIVCGEVLAAIPKGYTGKETQILARHIMKNPKMVKLLSKKNLSSRKKRSSSSSSVSDPISTVGSSGLNGSISQLGIQGKKDNYAVANATGTFSSSVLFAPLSNAIQEEEEVTLHSPAREKQERNREIEQERIRASVFFRNDSGRKLYSGDVSCSSSITSIQSTSMYSAANVMTQRCPLGSQVVTNIEMKDELHSLDRSVTCSNNSFVSKPSRYSATPLIVDGDCGNGLKHQATDRISLSASMLEEIKREAAEAARVAARAAAEEAFSKRMTELMKDMNVSDDEKNRLLDNDDLSFHSAISFAMSPLSSNDRCDFPVSVSISEPPLAPSAVRSLTPYGSHGAFASEVKFISPYAQGSSASVTSPMSRYSQGFSLLAPKSSSPVPQLAQVSPQSSDGSFQKSFEQELKYSYSVEGQSTKASYSQSQSSSFDEDDDIEVSLVAEVLEGFYEVTKRAVSTYLTRKKQTLRLRELPSKLVQRNMHLKIMSIVCVIFLSYNHIIGDDKTSYFGMNQELPMFQNESVTSTTANNLDIVTKRKFSVRDLQQILFWFLLFTKGQHFLMLARPQRRQRRAWKSRVIPVN